MSNDPRRERSRLPVDPVIEAYKPGIDRTLLRENLKRTPEERLRRLMDLQRFAEELRRAGREAGSSSRADRHEDE